MTNLIDLLLESWGVVEVSMVLGSLFGNQHIRKITGSSSRLWPGISSAFASLVFMPTASPGIDRRTEFAWLAASVLRRRCRFPFAPFTPTGVASALPSNNGWPVKDAAQRGHR